VRTGAAALVVGLAAALGTVTGAVVVPDREPAAGRRSASTTVAEPVAPAGGSASPEPSGAARSPAPSGGSFSPSPGDAPSSTGLDEDPLSSADLLSAADFRAIGVEVLPSRSDVRMTITDCTEDEDTMAEIAKSGPPVQLVWGDAETAPEAETLVATEQAIIANEEADAKDVTRRILRKLANCQRPVHRIYGPTHVISLGPHVSVSWLGFIGNNLDSKGRRVEGASSGGVAVARSGLRVAVLDLQPYANATKFAELSRVAAVRLG
jgi:hypothetical protein